MYCLLKGKATIDMVLGMGKPEMLPKQKLNDVVHCIKVASGPKIFFESLPTKSKSQNLGFLAMKTVNSATSWCCGNRTNVEI